MVKENIIPIENKKPFEIVQEIENYQIKKSPLSLAARGKVVNKSGSNFLSDNKESYGPCEYSGCPYYSRFYLEYKLGEKREESCFGEVDYHQMRFETNDSSIVDETRSIFSYKGNEGWKRMEFSGLSTGYSSHGPRTEYWATSVEFNNIWQARTVLSYMRNKNIEIGWGVDNQVKNYISGKVSEHEREQSVNMTFTLSN